MFGTVKGLADTASVYGMKQLSAHLEKNGLVETLKELETAKRVANSRDASAQATTIGQLIYRDFVARHGGDKAKELSQPQFNQLMTVHDMLMDMGGGAEMRARLDDLMEEYIPFAQKEELYDNYSAAGVEAVSRADSAWQSLLMLVCWLVLPRVKTLRLRFLRLAVTRWLTGLVRSCLSPQL